MKKLIAWFAFAFAMAPSICHAAGRNWMSHLDGNKHISELSIPGTHNSCARFEPLVGTARCQNLTLSEQFDAGVRLIDIRCRHVRNSFFIYHGAVYQKANFDDVIADTVNFLNAHPSESIIMSVKEEYNASENNRSFESTFDSYVAKNPGKWLPTSVDPTLTQARGKIVLLRRFGARAVPKGIDASNWKDNASFDTGNLLRIQDEYQVSDNNAKWNSVVSLLNKARNDKKMHLYVNFTSGVQSFFGIPNIPAVSNIINRRVLDYFNNHRSGHFGCILMDFADATKCASIYLTNNSIPAMNLSRGPN